MGWTTWSDLADHLGVSSLVDDSTDAQLMQLALVSAEQQVASHCGRVFDVAATTASARVFHPQNAGCCYTDDIGSLTDLVVRSDDDDDGVYETVWSASAFLLRPLNGLNDGMVVPWTHITAVQTTPYFRLHDRRPSVQVTARWGWPSTPDAVRMATVLLAAQVFRAKDAPLGVAGFGETGVVRLRDLPMVTALLRPYRRMDRIGIA